MKKTPKTTNPTTLLNRNIALLGIVLNIAAGILNAVAQNGKFVVIAALGLGLCLWSYTYHSNKLREEDKDE